MNTDTRKQIAQLIGQINDIRVKVAAQGEGIMTMEEGRQVETVASYSVEQAARCLQNAADEMDEALSRLGSAQLT